MLSDIHSDVGDQLGVWLAHDTYEGMKLPPSRHIRDVNIGSNEVEQKKYGSIHCFEKKTAFDTALLEKFNADLGIMLGLPVAPCVMATTTPQPTMVSLGFYDESMSIVQNAYKEMNLHGDDEKKLFGFARDRSWVLDILRKEVRGDLHDRLKPYCDLLSETLPFLIWARIHDPNLSNIIDRRTSFESPVKDPAQRTGGYFIDLESSMSLLSPDYPSEADWDPKAIDEGDMRLVLKDWLAENLPPEEIFNPQKVWQTIGAIGKMPDSVIHAEEKRMARIVENYGFLSPKQKTEILGGLEGISDMLIKRRDQLPEFMQYYVPPIVETSPRDHAAPKPAPK